MFRKKYSQRIVSIIVLIMLIFSTFDSILLSYATDYARVVTNENAEDVEYSITQDGVLIVIINNGTYDASVPISNEHMATIEGITIPSTVNGVTVRKILKVINNTDLAIKEIVLPETLEEIGNEAFKEVLVRKVNIPNSVNKIGESAFSGNLLTEVNVPNNITTIENYTFSHNPLESITLGNNIKVIGEGAFEGNMSEGNTEFYSRHATVREITIPNSVEEIQARAFYYLPSLDKINLGNSVQTIGVAAFYGGQIKNLTIPNSVKTIGDGAFGNNCIENLTLGNALETIGKGAFSNRTVRKKYKRE